jgi:NADPH2:quinone reductase
MKAVFCKQLGGPENLAISESDPPIPGPNDVHIRVRAAGLNFADTLQIAGKYQSKLKPPFIPGMEVAGEIISLGSEVTRPLRIGQRVMAFMRGGGAFAEEALVDSEWLVPIPDEMDDIIAAGFPTVYGTSNFALKHRGQLKKGETLLVLGAAGGVGLTAVELGKQMGARVIAAAGGEKKM